MGRPVARKIAYLPPHPALRATLSPEGERANSTDFTPSPTGERADFAAFALSQGRGRPAGPGEARRLSISRKAVVLLCGLLLLPVQIARASFKAAPRQAASAESKPLTTLQGKLLAAPDKCPILKMDGKEQPLSANTPYLLHTLQDKRLADREVRVEGRMQPEGLFQVEFLYTIHDGKLYRVRYFCKICNIEAIEPGNCVCCQQPTELQEIPVA